MFGHEAYITRTHKHAFQVSQPKYLNPIETKVKEIIDMHSYTTKAPKILKSMKGELRGWGGEGGGHGSKQLKADNSFRKNESTERKKQGIIQTICAKLQKYYYDISALKLKPLRFFSWPKIEYPSEQTKQLRTIF